ncbi:lectin C-type domain protein [Necator americanus]|uniref:Lectin C-type domain protein n=1 Tax=Necator americanus TaxID=51031 RepID=W2TRN7_NECAM|nr:lectin C-type domain protein [Necator americanus]ETN84473.1 lectin C-type domain protein [Necator americanus]
MKSFFERGYLNDPFPSEQITTTVAPTTPKTEVFCENGGTPLHQGTVNAACFCPELFTGKLCNQVNCMNGGTPLPGNLQCQCPPGFEGINCESEYDTNFYTRDFFQKFLDDIMAATSSPIVGGCEEVTFSAISSAFAQPINPKSAIYVFTDAIASDADQWRTVSESNTRRKLPIYTMILPNDNCTVNQYSDGYRALRRASEFSGGLTQLPTIYSLQQIFQYTMKATSYKMNPVLTDDMDKCDTKGSRIFFVDSSADSIIIFAVGQNLILSVTDPNWDRSAAMLIYSSGTSYFWEVTNVIPGEYLLSLTSQNPQTSCSYRVMSRSEYDLFLGTANVIDEDASDSEPVVGKAKHIVAQLNGLVNAVQDRFRLFAEITITTNINNENQARKPMYYSNGKYRDDCGYHLYFGVANFCQFPDQQFYATVYADDNNGYTIQRTTTGYCSATETTPAPPSICQNGGVPDPTNNSSCICPPSYSGAHCESAICQNGGTSLGPLCECVPGTGGFFCELMACTNTNTRPHVSFDGKSMSFVLSARPTMQQAVSSIANRIIDFVRDVQDSSSQWISTWNLIVVNNVDPSLVYTGSNPNDFVSSVQNVAQNLNNWITPNPTNCSVAIEAGLLLATYYSEPRSSVYLFADSDGGDDETYVTLFSHATEYQISLNLIGVGNSICTTPDNNGQFPMYLQSLSAMTSGFVYMTTQVSQMLPFIVSTYKSGIASRVYYDDCTNATYYVPIDASTESFTIAVSAQNLSSVTVTLPDGTPGLHNLLSVPMIDDAELNIQQFIQGSCFLSTLSISLDFFFKCYCDYLACDGYQWNYQEQYCYRFPADKFTWLKANQFCHSIGGYMADVHSQEKDDYIKKQTSGASAWIGLMKNNNNWVWDVPDGNSYQSIGNYTNWAPGVDPNNTPYSCVISDQNGQWVPTDCNQQNYAVCQKYRYGQGLTPGNSTIQCVNDLFVLDMVPAGLWKIQLRTTKGSCKAHVRAQSDIQVFFGFTAQANGDFPELYANSLSLSNQKYWYPPVISSNSDDIVAAVANITTMACPGPNDCSPYCARPIMETLKTVLALPDVVVPNSIILVVSRSSPEDYTLVNSMVQQLIDSKAQVDFSTKFPPEAIRGFKKSSLFIQINFILPAITSPCGEGWNTPASNAMYTATSYGDGDIFVMSPTDFTSNFLQQYIPSLYRTGNLEAGGSTNCTYQEYLFQVEHSMYEFTIDYYHPIVNPPVVVTLTDPAGDTINFPPNLISSDSNYLGVVQVQIILSMITLFRQIIDILYPYGIFIQAPPATCDLSAVQQDTLFVVDASLQNSNSEANFKNVVSLLRSFTIQTQLPYKFSPDYAQVAAMTLADTAQGGFSYNAPEHSFDNVQMLLGNLTFLGRPGQSVTSAMQLAISSYGSANQGYRPSAQHILIYVTSTKEKEDFENSRPFIDFELSFYVTGSLAQLSSTQQDNGIIGDPVVDCADSYFEVRFETRNPFRGLIFVQDRLEDPRCRSPPASPGGQRNASIRLAFKECGVERRISVN